jgi:hypothetical protein
MGTAAQVVAVERHDVERVELHFVLLLAHLGTSLTYDN